VINKEKNIRSYSKQTFIQTNTMINKRKVMFLLSILISLISVSDSFSLKSSSSSTLSELQVISHQPSDVIAVSGERIRLKCTVLNRRGSCQWTKNGFGLGTDPDLPGYSRYSLDNTGDNCDLIIDPVLADDEAEYQCQIGPHSDVAGVSSDIVTVSVTHEPGVPYIVQAKYSDLIEVDAGEEITLECQSQGGKPGAEIVWRHGDGSKVEAEVMDIVTRMDDERTFRTSSVMKLIPETNEDIYCEASSSFFPIPRQSPSVKIRIKDQLTASLKFDKESLNVGDNVEVVCLVENGHSVVSYKWYLNNVEMTTEKLNMIKLENVAARHNNLMIKCEVESNGEKVAVEKPLVVNSPLKIVQHPGHVLVSVGDLVTLHCAAEAGHGDDISYVWTRVSDKKLLGVGQELRLKMTPDMEGDVTCTVISGDQIVTTTATLTLKQKPIMNISGEALQYTSVSSTFVITCNIRNFYHGSQVTWYKDNKKIVADETKYKLDQRLDDEHNMMQADLVLLNVEDIDFGMYKCEATNGQGQVSIAVELANENSGYYVISVVVNIFGILLVLGFIVICYVVRRKSLSNVDFMEEEKKKYHSNIFTGEQGIFDKLLAIKNPSFSIDMDFKLDNDDVNESSVLKKPNRLNRFYSAPNGSFLSDNSRDNTVISFVTDED